MKRLADGPGGFDTSVIRVQGRDLLRVTLHRETNIDELCVLFRLQPDVVLEALLTLAANGRAVRALYRNIGGPLLEGVPDFPGYAQARRELRQAANELAVFGNEVVGVITDAPYRGWSIQAEEPFAILLPLPRGFLNLQREAAAARERETRIRGTAVDFSALDGELQQIQDVSKDLQEWLRTFKEWMQDEANEYGILEALDGALGVLLKFPAATVDPGDRSDMERLREQLLTLKTETHRHLLDLPVETSEITAKEIVERNSADLRTLVEAPTFVAHVKTLASNLDLAPPDLWANTLDTLRLAFSTLALSPEAESVAAVHIVPMIDALAAREFDLAGLNAQNNRDLDRSIREVPAAPPPNSVLVILVSTAGVLPSAVGNYPGPNTLAVGLLDIFAPILVARVVGNVTEAGRFSGRLYRALVTLASEDAWPQGRPLTFEQRVALLEAIDEGNLARLRQVNWAGRFMSSPAWGGVIAVASAACLIAAIQADDSSTLRYWSNILASGTGTALGVAVAFARYSDLVRNGIVRGVGGKALGAIGGLAAAISGTVTAIEEYKTGDVRGTFIAATGALGGAISVAGFMISAGALTSATVAGVPLGIAMMAAGAIIGIGAAIVGLVRSLTTAGSQTVFEAYINQFGRDFGPYYFAAEERPTLRAAFEAVQTGQFSVDFWDAQADSIPYLFDVGFGYTGDNQAIESFVDEDEDFVTLRLRQAQRI